MKASSSADPGNGWPDVMGRTGGQPVGAGRRRDPFPA